MSSSESEKRRKFDAPGGGRQPSAAVFLWLFSFVNVINTNAADQAAAVNPPGNAGGFSVSLSQKLILRTILPFHSGGQPRLVVSG
jgi:hypothetical protein